MIINNVEPKSYERAGGSCERRERLMAVDERKKSVWKRIGKQKQIQTFVWAGLLFLFVFNFVPMFGIIMAFENYSIADGVKGLFTSEWVGLKYFREFVNDYNFFSLIRNTLVLSLSKMVFTLPLPILLALIINEIRSRLVKRIVQTVSYLPYFISWVIVAGFCQLFLKSNGIVNNMLISIGSIEQPIAFMTGKQYFLPIAIFTACWKDMGWWAILFLSAIAGIDPNLYEAAEMDGCSRLKRIWHITLPGIKSTITVVLILSLGNLLGGGLGGSNFDQAWLLGNGGNSEVSEIIQTYVMKIGLSKGRYAYAAAIGLCQSIISVVLVFTSNFFSKKVSGDSLF